jgi:hypothetical protein
MPYAADDRHDGSSSSISASVSGESRGSTSSSAARAEISLTTARSTSSSPVAWAPFSRSRPSSSGWQVDAKRARRGCLTGPRTLPEGDLAGVRLTHGVLSQPARQGHCLLNAGDGNLIAVTVPAE